MFRFVKDIADAAVFKMSVATVEIPLERPDAVSAFTELAPLDHTVIIIEIPERDAASAILKETVVDPLFRAGGIHLAPSGVNSGETAVQKCAVPEQVMPLETGPAHVDCGGSATAPLESHADNPRPCEPEHPEHRAVFGTVPDNHRVTTVPDNRKTGGTCGGTLLKRPRQKCVGDPVPPRRKVDGPSPCLRGGDRHLNRGGIVIFAVASGNQTVPCFRCLDGNPVGPFFPVQTRNHGRRGTKGNSGKKRYSGQKLFQIHLVSLFVLYFCVQTLFFKIPRRLFPDRSIGAVISIHSFFRNVLRMTIHVKCIA